MLDRWKFSSWVVVVALIGVAGCGADTYVYSPESPDVTVDGYPGARYSVPPERPNGEVRVASFGITGLRLDPETRQDVIHVRLIVDNQGDSTPWRVDVREQWLQLPSGQRVRPMGVNATETGLPIVTVPRRQARTLDLYYPAPAGVTRDADLSGFQVLWQVDTGARRIARRTSFELIDVDPYYYDPAFMYSTGWGPYWWWYEPYPYTFTYPRVVYPPRPHDVVIRGEVPVREPR